jgi:hypothetical protein
MKLWYRLLLSVLTLNFIGGKLENFEFTAFAQSGSSRTFQLAAGTSLGWLSRRDFGEGNSERFYLEPVVHGYFPTPVQHLFLRPSLMASYVWTQPEMPQALRIEETDFYFGLGAGFVYDWVVLPSLSFGAHWVNRSIKLVTKDPVTVENDQISRSENLTALYAQLGLGVPLFEGFLVIEPFYRFRVFLDDERESGAYGIETTLQIF